MYTFRHIALFLVLWFGVSAALLAVPVTFLVDMSQVTISPSGVHIAGDFQGWDPSATPMTHLGNGVYSVTIDLAPGVYNFKFINGNMWGPDELVPDACGTDNGFGGYNREVIVGTDDVVLDIVCFGQCGACTTGLYTLNGDAFAMGGDCYAITGDTEWQNGTVWYGNQLDLTQPFDLQFILNLGDEDVNGADGVVFALQRISSTAIGASGGGMGFQSFTNAFGVEFDTYENLEFSDPAFDHIAVQLNGDVTHGSPANIAGPVQMSSAASNTEDNSDHVVQITWDPTSYLFEVFFDCALRLSVNYDIATNVFFGQSMVYWGFTGATGLYTNNQRVCLQSTAIQVNDLTICPGGSVQLSGGSSSTGTWSWSPADYLDDPLTANPVASPPATMTYEVTLTDLCGNAVTRFVTVNVLENNLACGIVPVQLVSFEVTPLYSSDHVQWITLSEWNNAGFEVQRSVNGEYFETVATHAGSGTQWYVSSYSLQVQPLSEPCYYRLVQLDFDGLETAVSPVLYVSRRNGSEATMTLTADRLLRVRSSSLSSRLSISVCDVTGRILQRVEWNHRAGEVFETPLASGFCVVALTTQEGELLATSRFP